VDAIPTSSCETYALVSLLSTNPFLFGIFTETLLPEPVTDVSLPSKLMMLMPPTLPTMVLSSLTVRLPTCP